MGQNFPRKLDTLEATSRKCSLKMAFYSNNVANIYGNVQEEAIRCLKQLHYNNTFPWLCYHKFAAKIDPHLLRCGSTAIGRTECVFPREKQGKNTITKSMKMQL